MPWRSKGASLRAVKGCFGAAGKDAKKRAKCRTLAHEAHAWRKGKHMKHGASKASKRMRR